ncbi:MAG TPA: hypothetical protein VMY99_00380 [Nevskiaceae bacterium]|nr:hypothetical protein [Nevskiaceae bacterium]
MSTLARLHTWHQTRAGLLVFGALELGVAYLFVSLAINSGSWWQYALTFIFFVGSLQNAVRLIRIFASGSTNKTTKA